MSEKDAFLEKEFDFGKAVKNPYAFDKTSKVSGTKTSEKAPALKELEEIVASYSPIQDPEIEIQEARDEKYGVVD